MPPLEPCPQPQPSVWPVVSSAVHACNNCGAVIAECECSEATVLYVPNQPTPALCFGCFTAPCICNELSELSDPSSYFPSDNSAWSDPAPDMPIHMRLRSGGIFRRAHYPRPPTRRGRSRSRSSPRSRSRSPQRIDSMDATTTDCSSGCGPQLNPLL